MEQGLNGREVEQVITFGLTAFMQNDLSGDLVNNAPPFKESKSSRAKVSAISTSSMVE